MTLVLVIVLIALAFGFVFAKLGEIAKIVSTLNDDVQRISKKLDNIKDK